MKFIKIIKNSFLLKISKLRLYFKDLSPKTYNLKPSSGFTLIETLVAISILMIAVTSPLTIAQKGLSSAFYAKDQIIASYLAQDAIEYLRNLSDQNVANDDDWLNGATGGKDIKTPCSVWCKVDTSLGSGITACSGTCDRLNYNELTYVYNHEAIGASNKVSSFTRSVKVEETVIGKEALITVNMSWTDKGKQRNFTVNTRIFNWR